MSHGHSFTGNTNVSSPFSMVHRILPYMTSAQKYLKVADKRCIKLKNKGWKSKSTNFADVIHGSPLT